MSATPETDALWRKHRSLSPACATDFIERSQKLEIERDMLRSRLAELSRLWSTKGEICGQLGRDADMGFKDTGDAYRQRRAAFFECAADLEKLLTPGKHDAEG